MTCVCGYTVDQIASTIPSKGDFIKLTGEFDVQAPTVGWHPNQRIHLFVCPQCGTLKAADLPGMDNK